MDWDSAKSACPCACAWAWANPPFAVALLMAPAKPGCEIPKPPSPPVAVAMDNALPEPLAEALLLAVALPPAPPKPKSPCKMAAPPAPPIAVAADVALLSRFHLVNQQIGFLRFSACADSQGEWHGGKVFGCGEP